MKNRTLHPRRRGLSLVEALMSLAMSAMLLTAGGAASRASGEPAYTTGQVISSNGGMI